jgi:hypothetical protein
VALEIVPEPAEQELTAIRHALSRAGVRLDGQPESYLSGWRRASAREGVDNEPAPVRTGYARSPRSTRGATRA